jgi:hypothetical protein
MAVNDQYLSFDALKEQSFTIKQWVLMVKSLVLMRRLFILGSSVFFFSRYLSGIVEE